MILDFIKCDLSEDNCLYKSVYNQIKNAINRGVIEIGEKLPSVREASSQLGISRTTVENAYAQLCIEGIAESRPQKGYYIIGKAKPPNDTPFSKSISSHNIKYDFSSRRIDISCADTETWRRLIRSVLRNSDVLTSYGDPQGEYELRKALATYTYKARGVITKPDNIIIGAGIGPLLNILCGVIEKNKTIGIENGSFKEAETIFSDYGIKTVSLKTDSNGAVISEIEQSQTDILFLMPSTLSRISITGISNRRNSFIKWANGDKSRYIIEDDYNGELRYTARTLPAFQGKLPHKCIYIGSFSKLLLPSVRIAYMVLPDSLINIFKEKMAYYNQTCGKTEQIALTEYINCGSLEKHLRKLRRVYYFKSQLLIKELQKYPDIFKKIKLLETSLSVFVQTSLKTESGEICRICEKNGIKIMATSTLGEIKLCFAGINQAELSDSIKHLYKVLSKI